MKIIPALAVAAALVSTQAMAADPTSPYHIVTPYVGSATVQAVGSCKISKVFAEARWGTVIDTVSSLPVGEGLITKDGKLIAIVQSAFYLGGQLNNVTQKQSAGYFEDLSSFGPVSTATALQDWSTNSTCVVDLLEAGQQTKSTYLKTPTTTAGKFIEKFTVLYPFSGAGNPAPPTVVGNITTEAKRVFVGKITFVGQRTLIVP